MGEEACAVAGAAFGALIAANCECLESLDISCLGLGDDALRFVTAALPVNSNLGQLHMAFNVSTEEFVREELIPALALNTGLTDLYLASEEDTDLQQVLLEAETLISARQQR